MIADPPRICNDAKIGVGPKSTDGHRVALAETNIFANAIQFHLR
ncbi:unnamed protein product [Acidithrix sp. C25]|nr:unnamed protein product [Acidithrix sp. C25]